MFRRLWLLLLVLSLLPLGPGPVQAQQADPISMTVEAGFDGLYISYLWFPVSVTLANDGPDVNALVRWNFPAQQNEGVFELPIELPRGSRKRVLLPVFSRNSARNGRVELLVNNRVVLRNDVPLDPREPSLYLIGVLSSDPGLLNSLSGMIMPGASGIAVVHLSPETLPDRAALLQSLNTLFIHDIDSSALSPQQREAIEVWTATGGQLIFSGGAAADRTVAGFADLLPVEPALELQQGSLQALQRFALTPEPPQGEVALSRAALRPGAEPVADGLLARRLSGAGTVWFSSFDLGALAGWSGRANNRGWNGEVELWERLLDTRARFLPAGMFRQQRDDLLRGVLRIPELGLPSGWSLLLFLTLYVVVIGPLNLLVLARLRRRELAWLTVPAIVLLFVVFTYLASVGIRGTQARLLQLAVVQGAEGSSQGLATAFVGLFSPRRADYSLQFAGEPLVSEMRSWESTNTSDAPVRYVPSATQINDVLVDVSSLRTFISEQMVELPVLVESELLQRGADISGQLRNAGSEPLIDALLVRGDSAQLLGTIEPNQTVEFQLMRGIGNFPYNAGLSSDGSFDRQQMINSLFGFQAFGVVPGPVGPSPGFPETEGVYLLAWRESASVDVQLAGGAGQQALTLYVIRLDQDAAMLPLSNVVVTEEAVPGELQEPTMPPGFVLITPEPAQPLPTSVVQP